MRGEMEWSSCLVVECPDLKAPQVHLPAHEGGLREGREGLNGARTEGERGKEGKRERGKERKEQHLSADKGILHFLQLAPRIGQIG